MWSSILLWVVGIVAIFTIDRIVRRWKLNHKHKNLPPGSMGLPFVGETLQLFSPIASFDLHPFFKTRFQRFGPIFRTSMMGTQVVVSADQEVNKYILQQEESGAAELWYFDTFSQILALDNPKTRMGALGAAHKYVRNTLLNHFGCIGLQQNLLSQIEYFVNEALMTWSTRPSVEIKRELLLLLVNFNAKKLFSYDAENSSENLNEKFCTILDGIMSFPLNVPGTLHYKCIKESKNVIRILEDVMKERFNNKKCDDANKGDVLEQMINNLGSQKILSKDFIINLIFIIILAASEAVSTIGTLLLKFLDENPLVVKEIVAEHEAIINRRSNPNSSLTWDEYKSLTFTHQVINECIRMANFTPGLLRRAVKDITVKGFVIPAGWTIMLVTSTMHLNSNAYSDPLKFNPWRWKDLDTDIISKNFMPFGHGIRQCPGTDYTKASMAIFVHVLVLKYRWKKVKGGDISRGINLGFGANGLHVNFSKK